MNPENDELETLYVASCDERIEGWYVVEAGISPPHTWTFSDAGSGPEVVNNSAVIEGPFESEDAAGKYLADYIADVRAAEDEDEEKRYLEEMRECVIVCGRIVWSASDADAYVNGFDSSEPLENLTASRDYCEADLDAIREVIAGRTKDVDDVTRDEVEAASYDAYDMMLQACRRRLAGRKQGR